MRRSIAGKSNHQLGDWSQWIVDKNVSNMDFFAEALDTMDKDCGVGNGGVMAIGLVGSRDIPGTTLRRAQSVLRWDRRPSKWSHAFLLRKPRTRMKTTRILEVPLHARNGVFPRPEENGLNENATLNAYEDSDVDVNVALIVVARRIVTTKGRVTLANLDPGEINKVEKHAEEPNSDRLRYDLWESLSVWKQYLWSDGAGINPLREGVPVPSAAYVEMAYEAIGLDLVPGASERNSAPEHIWNAARWWHQESVAKEEGADASPYIMTGCFAVRDYGGSMIR